MPINVGKYQTELYFPLKAELYYRCCGDSLSQTVKHLSIGTDIRMPAPSEPSAC